MRASWIDPVTQREVSADIHKWRIEGSWMVLSALADPGAGWRKARTVFVPGATVVNIEEDE